MLDETTQSVELPESAAPQAAGWQQSLVDAIRDPKTLLQSLDLPLDLVDQAASATALFPLLVPRSFLHRMKAGDASDPLLLQVIPRIEEHSTTVGFVHDAVEESRFESASGLLHKYNGRALMIATGTCAIHCRYCFRRHYPYSEAPRSFEQWQPALEAIRDDSSLHEIILSGGDPLVLNDHRLQQLITSFDEIPHLRRLRIHTRLPVVLPDRVTKSLLQLLRASRLTPIMIVHANHANELVNDAADSLRNLVRAGITVLNQTVLMRGINDSVETQAALCERLVDLGVIPYYLHQLDRVLGTAHFEVDESVGIAIISALRDRLPGYAVPTYVREIPGRAAKTVLNGVPRDVAGSAK